MELIGHFMKTLHKKIIEIRYSFFVYNMTCFFIFNIYNSAKGDIMRKKFVAKKRRKISFHFHFRYVIYILLIYFCYQLIAGYLGKIKLTRSNHDILMAMMKDTNHFVFYEKKNTNLIASATKLLTGINLSNPVETMGVAFRYADPQEKKTDIVATVSKEDSDEKKEKPKVTPTQKPKGVFSPKVYIYNTHQMEGYSMKNLEVYNITPNVMMASYLLQEKLKSFQIESIVEETNVNEYMTLNKWKVKDAYKVTNLLLKNTVEKYPEMDLFIDLHRDALSKSNSTTVINNISYAKVLFVVGLEHKNYQKNLAVATKLNSILNQKYPNLSRGILKKQGAGVNGIYNQDVNGKVVLIECGGNENTIDEVSNTIDALSKVIKEYLGG